MEERVEGYIKIDPREIGSEDVKLIKLVQGRGIIAGSFGD